MTRDARRLYRWATTNSTLILAVIVLIVVMWGKVAGTAHHQAMTDRATARATMTVASEQKALQVVLANVAAEQQAVAASAAQACQIQARGLTAQRYLTGSLDGILRLLRIPPSAEARKAARALPKRVLRRERRLLRTLTGNLEAYVAITRQQPPSRTC